MRGYIFGGYTSINWKSERGAAYDSKAFLFSVNKKLKIPVQDAS